MPNKKHSFPITYFKKHQTIITLGGWDGSERLKEVTEYSLKYNMWTALPSLPFGVYWSSICVIKNEWLYNFGGERKCKWGVEKLALTGRGRINHNNWKEVKLSNN